jgi:hypothetical protein
LLGGGSYGNATHGIEASHGGAIGSNATDSSASNQYGTLQYGFQSSCNGSAGASAESGTIMLFTATLVANGFVDFYALDAGIAKQFKCAWGYMSPAPNTVGNLNAICVDYGQ